MKQFLTDIFTAVFAVTFLAGSAVVVLGIFEILCWIITGEFFHFC